MRRRHTSGRLLWSAAILLAFVLVLWGGGLLWFVSKIPTSVEDTKTKTDAIAVLTGGRGRLDVGFQLLSDKLAKKLFISGVYRGVDVNHLLELFKQKPEDLRCCLEIGHSADNTTGNAIETATWFKKNSFQSLRVVTSGYHMPRTMLEFHAALSEVLLIPHSVFTDHVKHERWWAWPGTSSLIVGEYNKYLLAWIRLKSESFKREIVGR